MLAHDIPCVSDPRRDHRLAGHRLIAVVFRPFPERPYGSPAHWAVVAYFGVGYFLRNTLGLDSSDSPLGSFWSWTGWLSVLLGGVAGADLSLSRVSNPAERKRTRWVLFGLGVMAVSS